MQETIDAVPVRDALDLAPIGTMVLRDGCLLWANKRLLEWLGGTLETLGGLARETATPLGLGVLFDEADRLGLVRAGGEIRLRRRRARLQNGDEIHYFEDLTELARLERDRDHFQELARILDTKDAETGLPNRSAILQALNSHVSRSRRYGNLLSLIRLTLQAPTSEKTSLSLRAIAQEFNAELRWADEIGRLDDNSLLLILPETACTDAQALAGKLGHERVAVAKAEGWTIDFTVAAWQAGDDSRKLLERLGVELSP